jgi:biotin operon repressor
MKRDEWEQDDNASPFALRLPEVSCSGETFVWSPESQDAIKRGRLDYKIVSYLLTEAEFPISVETVAKRLQTNCKAIRRVVERLKEDGLLVESTTPRHFLLKMKA